MNLFVIRSNDTTDDLLDDGQMFWSNESGWVSLTSATVFDEGEVKTADLPMGDEHEPTWVQLPVYQRVDRSNYPINHNILAEDFREDREMTHGDAVWLLNALRTMCNAYDELLDER